MQCGRGGVRVCFPSGLFVFPVDYAYTMACVSISKSHVIGWAWVSPTVVRSMSSFVCTVHDSLVPRSLEKQSGNFHEFKLYMDVISLLSCDNVLKFDWYLYCQRSGSRNNSLNSQKFPVHSSYGLGMRPGTSWYVAANTASSAISIVKIPCDISTACNQYHSNTQFWKEVWYLYFWVYSICTFHFLHWTSATLQWCQVTLGQILLATVVNIWMQPFISIFVLYMWGEDCHHWRC